MELILVQKFMMHNQAMDSAFHVSGNPDALLIELCPVDERGHLRFGFAGSSRAPSDHNLLLMGQVEFVDYVLEGFVVYTLSAERTTDGLRLVVRKTGTTERDKAIDWFVEKYLRSKDLVFSKSAM